MYNQIDYKYVLFTNLKTFFKVGSELIFLSLLNTRFSD